MPPKGDLATFWIPGWDLFRLWELASEKKVIWGVIFEDMFVVVFYMHFFLLKNMICRKVAFHYRESIIFEGQGSIYLVLGTVSPPGVDLPGSLGSICRGPLYY